MEALISISTYRFRDRQASSSTLVSKSMMQRCVRDVVNGIEKQNADCSLLDGPKNLEYVQLNMFVIFSRS